MKNRQRRPPAADQAKPRTPRPSRPGTPPADLTKQQIKHLRSLGHAIKPAVRIGKEGISDGLVRSICEALIDHELIKVKLLQNCSLEKKEAARTVASRTGAALIQSIGKTMLLYAPHPTDPVIQLPSPSAPRSET